MARCAAVIPQSLSRFTETSLTREVLTSGGNAPCASSVRESEARSVDQQSTPQEPRHIATIATVGVLSIDPAPLLVKLIILLWFSAGRPSQKVMVNALREDLPGRGRVGLEAPVSRWWHGAQRWCRLGRQPPTSGHCDGPNVAP